MTKEKNPVKTLALEESAELLRALAHPVRLAILQELSLGAKCVTDIQDLVDGAQASVSKHLMALREIGVVDFHKDGKLRCYYITRPSLVKALVKMLAAPHPVILRTPQSVRREGLKRTVQQTR
jgi:ArsR family transcriptional regulator